MSVAAPRGVSVYISIMFPELKLQQLRQSGDTSHWHQCNALDLGQHIIILDFLRALFFLNT